MVKVVLTLEALAGRWIYSCFLAQVRHVAKPDITKEGKYSPPTVRGSKCLEQTI